MIYLIKPFITQIYVFNKQLVTIILLIYNEQILFYPWFMQWWWT